MSNICIIWLPEGEKRMGQKKTIWEINSQIIPQLGEGHKLTVSRTLANSKQDKYDENRPWHIHSQIVKDQR